MIHSFTPVRLSTCLGVLLAMSGCKRTANAGPNAAATPITWRDTASRYRSQTGAVLTFQCPPGGASSTVWGTDTYSDDSSICTAAAHSGRITRAAGGVVQIQMAPGLPAYQGTARGGETTRHFGVFPGSFVVVGGPQPGLVAIPIPQLNGNGVRIGDVQIRVGGGASGAWAERATPHRGSNGSSFTQVCPPGGALGSVWGTDVYTDDSSVCSAAVHAGRITLAQGGAVTYFVLPGRSGYTGSARNGVSAMNFGTFPGSFAFTASVAPEPTGPAGVEAITWSANATRFRAMGRARQMVWCPPRGTPATVWGDGPFTDDSSICTAAVYSGRITFLEGGVVRLRARPGQSSYDGDTRNGVTSRPFGVYPGSFEITR